MRALRVCTVYARGLACVQMRAQNTQTELHANCNAALHCTFKCNAKAHCKRTYRKCMGFFVARAARARSRSLCNGEKTAKNDRD